MLRSAVETGTPFAFNRDSVNRMNPNGHTGMIYCSNLCTEIAQNMAPIEHISTEVHTENGDTVVVTATRQVSLWSATWRVCLSVICRWRTRLYGTHGGNGHPRTG